jgi:integration host factor subunit beta
MKAMTKSELTDHLCERQKMAKGRAEQIVNAIFDCLEAALKRGERIEIRGFGSFEVRSYKAYEGRNPRSGTPVAVKPKRLPFFKVGKELKERVDMAAARERTNTTAAQALGENLNDDPKSDARPEPSDEDTPVPRVLPAEIPGARL